MNTAGDQGIDFDLSGDSDELNARFNIIEASKLTGEGIKNIVKGVSEMKSKIPN